MQQFQDAVENLEAGNLRLTGGAVAEVDRDFSDGETCLAQPIDGLHEERIAVVMHLGEVHHRQLAYAECAVRRGELVQWNPEQEPCRAVGGDTDKAPITRVVARAARHITRADDKIGGIELIDHLGNVARIVREIGIHGHEDVEVVHDCK